MLRSRKVSMAGIAVGALALTCTTMVPVAYGHGYTTSPISRAKNCQSGVVQNCGQIQWEPQSVEGPKGFPNAGPADGKLCSAGLQQFDQLNATKQPNGQAWPSTQLTMGANYTFSWTFTASHATTDFKYYMTKAGWNGSHALTRADLDLTPFLTVPYNNQRPPSSLSHSGRLPSRSGPHMILAVWTIADTANAFYQCSDVRF
ncbi:lytic polysaccharide monooxygenase [Kribbella sp. NPDC058245]|uniref:lytic polysaccharide monooxygenase auxiliary activity family 9 protein n=1 Tax=Kribbella sp. NPDC058245 TaxID=3346399 RepID=UPI0036F01169